VRLEEEDLGCSDEPDILGYALIYNIGDLFHVRFIIQEGLDWRSRAAFADWAKEHLRRFAEHGPDPDGWYRRSDGGWQFWVRQVQKPDPGF
jgi:hypothetical protein